MLKIRGGKYLHRVIEQPDMSITRPTKDSAKEGIFNSLGSLRGLSFLDLFSGSGQMAIEAISRGAEKVVANDINRSAYNIIQGNLKKLGINEIKTYNLDYKNCLKKFMKDFFYVIGIIVSILIILSAQAFVVYVFAGLHWIIGLIVLFIFIVIDFYGISD